MPPDEAAFLRLRSYRGKEWPALVGTEFDALLRYEMTPRLAAQFCAYLIGHPDPASFKRYYDRFLAANLPLDAASVHLFQATFLAAVIAGQTDSAEQIAAKINQFTASDTRALHGLGALLKSPTAGPRLGRILPLVPLPTEVIYAILDRQTAATASAK